MTAPYVVLIYNEDTKGTKENQTRTEKWVPSVPLTITYHGCSPIPCLTRLNSGWHDRLLRY